MLHAFDPGTALGWAYWRPGAGGPVSRLINLKAESEGAVYARAQSHLRDIINAGDLVAVEAPVLPQGVSIGSRLVLFGIRAIIFKVAFERGANRIVEFPPSEWRRHYLGVSQAPKGTPKNKRRDWIKRKAQAAAVERGWGAVTVDEADALGILDFFRSKVDQDYAAASVPMFRGLV